MSHFDHSPFLTPQYETKMWVKTRDSQRSRVYKWEEDYLNIVPVAPEEIKDVLAQLANFYQIGLRITFADASGAFAFHNKDRDGYRGIKMPLYGMGCSIEIACHEFAHIICTSIWDDCGTNCDSEVLRSPHGPEWLTVYMFLLINHCGIDRNYLVNTAAIRKLKFYPHMLKGAN